MRQTLINALKDQGIEYIGELFGMPVYSSEKIPKDKFKLIKSDEIGAYVVKEYKE